MIEPRSSSILTTGMFNLIVKDPCRYPPERAAWIGNRSIAAALELVALCFGANVLRLSQIASPGQAQS
jgi:hypothetical protein